MIFLCWFGAAGYLLTKYGSFVAGVVVVLAAICGLAGGAIIFMFLTKVLMPHEQELTADETDVVGVVGQCRRRFAPGEPERLCTSNWARRDRHVRVQRTARRIEKEEEVYVIRYEKGIAYVKRWEDLDASDQLSVNSDQKQATSR